MAQAIIHLGEHEDRILTIVKGKYGLRNKSDAVNYVISRFESDILEPHLKPEYIAKLKKIKSTKGIRFNNIDELKAHIKNAKI